MNQDELKRWLKSIGESNRTFRRKIGWLKIAAFRLAVTLLALPRFLRASGAGTSAQAPDWQLPWLPRLPRLTAMPLHHPAAYAWTDALRGACDEIRTELLAVRTALTRAHYDSDINPKPWNTYYFYIRGKPVQAHLDACPVTASILSQIPHNGFHICFSAIEPGGSLHPHTGPTNASLTAHLGLSGCARSRLFVAEAETPYRDGEVLIFDDTFVHHVENAGDDIRYTLMITFWHPDLSRLERWFMSQILQFEPA